MKRTSSFFTSGGRRPESAVSAFDDLPPSGQTTTPAPQPGPSGASGSMGFVMDTVNSAIALVKNPLSYITSNKDSPATVMGIMVNYVAVLAAIPFFATLLGDLWWYSLYIPLNFAGSYVAYAFTSAVLVYILDVIAVYVIAMVVRFLAPTFNSAADEIKSLKLAAYVFTPVFLISVLDIVPLLGFVTVLGVLYGLYILYLGLPVMLGTSKERVVTYVIAVVIATFVVYAVIGLIIGVITGAVFHAALGYFY